MRLRRGGGLRIRGPDSLGRCDECFYNLFFMFHFFTTFIHLLEKFVFFFCFVDNGWVYAARFTWCFDGGVYKWAMMSVCIR